MQHEERYVTESECAEKRKNPVWSLGHLGPRAVTWQRKTQPSQQEAVFSVILRWFSNRMNKSEWPWEGMPLSLDSILIWPHYLSLAHTWPIFGGQEKDLRERKLPMRKKRNTLFNPGTLFHAIDSTDLLGGPRCGPGGGPLNGGPREGGPRPLSE